MARRPHRFALGPSSEHATEIAQAIQLVEAKTGSIDGADNLVGNRDLGQESPSMVAMGTDDVQITQGSSLEDDACLITNTNNDPDDGDQSINEAQSSPLAFGTEEKGGSTDADGQLLQEIMPAEDHCLLEITQPDAQTDDSEIVNEDDDANLPSLKEEQYRPEAIHSPVLKNTSGEVSVSKEALSGSSVDQSETTKRLSFETAGDTTSLTKVEAIVVGQDEGRVDTDGTDDFLVTINKLVPKGPSAQYCKQPR